MKYRVMVVDDDDDILKLVTKVLEINGMEPVPAHSGLECLYQLDHGSIPDAILLDIMMPEKDGYAVCREVKSNIKYKDIVVVMLTAKAENRDKVDSYKSGADGYIVKPFDNDALIADLKSFLAEKGKL
jgi:DNA-binding response OmpR family regulator